MSFHESCFRRIFHESLKGVSMKVALEGVSMNEVLKGFSTKVTLEEVSMNFAAYLLQKTGNKPQACICEVLNKSDSTL